MKKKYITTLLTVLLACPIYVKANDTADLDDIKLYDIVKVEQCQTLPTTQYKDMPEN